MDKESFFSDFGLRTSTITLSGSDKKVGIRELSAGQRERILSLGEGKGVHSLSALTVALGCVDFSDDDVDRLLDEIKPEILLEISEAIYSLSGLSEAARDDAKKP